MRDVLPVFVNLPNGRMFAILRPDNDIFDFKINPITAFELNLFTKGDSVILSGQRIQFSDMQLIERHLVLVSAWFYVENRTNLWSLCKRRSRFFELREKALELVPGFFYGFMICRPILCRDTRYGWKRTFFEGEKNYPCRRFDHSFIVDDKGEFGYLVGGFTKLIVKGTIFDNWIYYPTDDLWQIDLKTKEWTRIIDFSVPFPKNTSQLSSIPACFINLNIFYDAQSHSIVGNGTRVYIDRHPDDKDWKKNCSFIIDIAKQTYHLIEDTQPHIFRLSKFQALALSATPLWMFKNLEQPKHRKSHYCWYGDSNRELKENLLELISQKMTKAYPSRVYLSDKHLDSSDYRDFCDSLTWSDLMKVDKWFLEFESPTLD